MFLLAFISFLLARRLGRKTYIFLMIVAIASISFLSVGFPSFYGHSQSFYGNRILLLKVENPLPLSLPFHATVSISYGYFGTFPHYEIYFSAIKLADLEAYPTQGKFFLYCTFFSLINIIGAIFGYWISKTTFIDKLLARRKTKVEPA